MLSAVVGDVEPLYVIDGTPTEASGMSGFKWFEPEDIAEIKGVAVSRGNRRVWSAWREWRGPHHHEDTGEGAEQGAVR